MAEDNAGDVFLIREALASAHINAELTVKRDGEQMLHYVDALDNGEAPVPEVILLDLNLPRANGEQILSRIRECQACRSVPVVVITSSNSPYDRDMANRSGAYAYFRKPSELDEFLRLGNLIKDLLESRAG